MAAADTPPDAGRVLGPCGGSGEVRDTDGRVSGWAGLARDVDMIRQEADRDRTDRVADLYDRSAASRDDRTVAHADMGRER